ncbi:outer membrane beta-barrel protein [Granulosicoccus antarcticus]|uniref:Outer membrane protein beta-barrel domain-containing protein n=1 Tax=Granulosicoccus antarcticus IMCC3135 TaxID=1192854 RepID=A0A2Z2NTJ1_9GAMM|nr:outer membrane beta-barrel protein [Granulosicoccus antarcticus]ASJ70434.1 hypothetical protein IMCC3135_01575 [Granulosicoccus antarcticus IMCC3135]
MRRLLSGLVLSLGLLSGAAHADPAKFYFGAGLADGSVDVTNGSDKTLGAISVTVGLQFLDFIGVEFGVGSGSDQSGSILSEPLVTYQSAMLRLGYRWDRVGVYLLGGHARMDIDSDYNNSDAGNVYGFGINLFGNETTALNLHVLDFDDGAFTSTTVGFQHYFGGFR